MPSKSDLIQKLTAKRMPRNFTVRDLDALMSKCDCEKYQGAEAPESDTGIFQLNGQFSLMLRIPEKSSMRIRLKLLSSS